MPTLQVQPYTHTTNLLCESISCQIGHRRSILWSSVDERTTTNIFRFFNFLVMFFMKATQRRLPKLCRLFCCSWHILHHCIRVFWNTSNCPLNNPSNSCFFKRIHGFIVHNRTRNNGRPHFRTLHASRGAPHLGNSRIEKLFEFNGLYLANPGQVFLLLLQRHGPEVGGVVKFLQAVMHIKLLQPPGIHCATRGYASDARGQGTFIGGSSDSFRWSRFPLGSSTGIKFMQVGVRGVHCWNRRNRWAPLIKFKAHYCWFLQMRMTFTVSNITIKPSNTKCSVLIVNDLWKFLAQWDILLGRELSGHWLRLPGIDGFTPNTNSGMANLGDQGPLALDKQVMHTISICFPLLLRATRALSSETNPKHPGELSFQGNSPWVAYPPKPVLRKMNNSSHPVVPWSSLDVGSEVSQTSDWASIK